MTVDTVLRASFQKTEVEGFQLSMRKEDDGGMRALQYRTIGAPPEVVEIDTPEPGRGIEGDISPR